MGCRSVGTLEMMGLCASFPSCSTIPSPQRADASSSTWMQNDSSRGKIGNRFRFQIQFRISLHLPCEIAVLKVGGPPANLLINQGVKGHTIRASPQLLILTIILISNLTAPEHNHIFEILKYNVMNN